LTIDNGQLKTIVGTSFARPKYPKAQPQQLSIINCPLNKGGNYEKNNSSTIDHNHNTNTTIFYGD
jgi:hypothetical protein